MARARVVLDTNVYISALLWTGIPHRRLRLAEAGDLSLLTTPAIMEELRKVLGRPKFRLRLRTLQSSSARLVVLGDHSGGSLVRAIEKKGNPCAEVWR